MALEQIFALMVGSDNDSLALGAYSKTTADLLKATDSFITTLPGGITDRGWISEDGMSLDHSDSVDKIRGHQGHGVVKSYMSESDTSFKATLYETQLETLVESLDISRGKVTGTGASAVAVLDVPSSRKTRLLNGIATMWDTSGSEAQLQLLFPTLSLGERTGVSFKVGEIMAYEYNLEVLGGYRLITNADGITGAAARFPGLLEALDTTPAPDPEG